MTRFIFAVLASSFSFLSTGCGQSGPLYLPGDPSQIQNPSPAPAEDEKDKDEDSDAPQQEF